MTAPFLIIALLTVASAIAAMSLRHLVHCALCLTLTFFGLAALYLQLGALFVGLAQILVYVGAVAILIVFAILLTGGGDAGRDSRFSSSWVLGAAVSLLVFSVLALSIHFSAAVSRKPTPEPHVTVRGIGDQLMTHYVLPLEVMALLLTAALIGAVIIAMREPGETK